MSFLAPLFFLAVAAIAAPILFHLIRRQTKDSLEFSSLMFLEPSPPRITRRSRIDQWLLLLIRTAALALVAFAFARPFIPSLGQLTTVQPTRLSVVLLDTSASMNREDLWQQALARLDQELSQADPGDLVKLLTFDSSTQLIADAEGRIDRQRLETLQPSNRPADLGAALIRAVDLIEETAQANNLPNAVRSIVLIGDLQNGSNTDALQGFRWPESIPLRIETVDVKQPTNVRFNVSTTSAETSTEIPDAEQTAGTAIRIRASNAESSQTAQFEFRLLDNAGQPLDAGQRLLEPLTIPPGETRALVIRDIPPETVAVQILGDDHPFDDLSYLIVPQPIEQIIRYVGLPVEDRRYSLAYYLSILPLDRPGRSVVFENISLETFNADNLDQAWDDPKRLPLVVFSNLPAPDRLENVKSYIRAGGNVIVVLDSVASIDPVTQTGLRLLTEDQSLTVDPAEVKDYALLANVDLGHPIFRSLSDARYSDFSKIQFWKHAVVATDDQTWSVPARFDDRLPAVLQRRLGDGEIVLLAAGWQPSDSQLALSTKFVPIISAIVGEPSREESWTSLEIGSMSSLAPSETATITGPDGKSLEYQTAAELLNIDQPGIYTYTDGELIRPFAVNIADAESQMGQLDRSLLEQLGVQLTSERMELAKEAGDRQLKDAELENRQRWWRWLIVAALGLIGIETWISRR